MGADGALRFEIARLTQPGTSRKPMPRDVPGLRRRSGYGAGVQLQSPESAPTVHS